MFTTTQSSKMQPSRLWPQRIGLSALMAVSLAFPLAVQANEVTVITVASPTPALPPVPPEVPADKPSDQKPAVENDLVADEDGGLASGPIDLTPIASSGSAAVDSAAERQVDQPGAAGQTSGFAESSATAGGEMDVTNSGDSALDATSLVEGVAAAGGEDTDAEVSTFEGEVFDSPEAATADVSSGQAADSSSQFGNVARSLSVQPGTDPLLPKDLPEWITKSVERVGDVDHFPVGGIPTSRKVNVDRGLNGPMRSALAKYVADLVGPGSFEGLGEHVTSDYIRKNLVDDPNGYVAPIATSEGPMYQKWVKLSVTPSQREQLQEWHRSEVQANQLPLVGIGLVGVLGLVFVSHLVLRRCFGKPTLQQDVRIGDVLAPKKSAGFLGVLAIVFLCLCIPGLLLVSLFGARTTVQRQQFHSEIQRALEETDMEAARAQAEAHAVAAEVAREVQRVREELSSRTGEVPVFGSEGQLINEAFGSTVDSTTTINENGGQTVIIRSR